MSFDILKPFKKCFFCKQRSVYPAFPLLRAVNPGYHTTYYYYHQECFQQVINNPEEHKHHVDMALQINDQINSDREKEIQRQNRLQASIQRAKELKSTPIVESEIPVEQNAEIIKTNKYQFLSKKL